MSCNTECINEVRIRVLEEKARKNSLNHEKIFGQLNAMEVRGATVDERYHSIVQTLGEIKSDLAKLNSVPGNRWEKIIWAVISAIVTLIVASVFKGAI